VSFHSQKPSADAHGLEFELTSDSEDLTMFGDAGRLQQVFSNVISNAIKFTPEGGRVSIRITSDPQFAKIRIEDTGQGISPDALPFIFRQFSQGDLNQEKSRSGLGLGLSIVKILVGKHGGTVEAESEGINKGAAFTVTLPLSRAAEGHPTKPRLKEDRSSSKALNGLTILIVEDDPDSREVLQLFLGQSGATVQAAQSAREAFRALGRRQDGLPDVIISDLAMPDEDGYSMMTKIRQLSRENGGHIPAIALSAFATNESKQKAMEAGFQTYSTKPFDPELLVNDILALAQRRP
jgi:CheY-like chemotaxis protein